MRQGFELGRPRKVARRGHLRVAGALIIGLSTFQAEFDFGVPQFQLLYQPVLIAFAAGVALVCARSILGRVGRLPGARRCSSSIRDRAGAVRRPGRRLHDAALPALRRRGGRRRGSRRSPLRARRCASRCSAGWASGRVGLAAEWGWSHVWMPHPWPASMLVPAVVLALAAGRGRQRARRAHEPEPRDARERARRPAADRARASSRWPAAVALVALFVPLPRTGGDGTRAADRPDARRATGASTSPSSSTRPTAARGNQWFEILSWQGRTPGQLRQLTALRQVGAGPLRHRAPRAGDRQLEDDAAPGQGHASDGACPSTCRPRRRPAAPAFRSRPRSGAMRADTFILQREARGGPAWLTTTAYAVLGVVVAVWLGAAGLGAGPRRAPAPAPPARYRGIDMATARRARLSTDARREQLVALGVEIFSERPFDEVSIDDIAASAGISKGLLYHYFPSKRDFYVAVVRHSADEMQAVTETDPDLAPLERLSDRPGQATWSTSRPTRAATRPCCAPASAPTARSRPSSRRSARRWSTASSTTSPAASRRPACASRSAAGSASPRPRASSGSSTASSRRDELRDLLIQALTGAIGAAASHYAVR